MSWKYVKLRRRDYRIRRWILLRNMRWHREDYREGRVPKHKWIWYRVYHQMQLRDLRMSYLYGRPKR